MKLDLSKDYDVNYLTKVVEIKEFTNHPDPEVTRLKVAHVDGFNVIVGIDEQPGMFLYFPVNSQISPSLLSFCNLYRHEYRNSVQTKTGLFNDNGRVTAINLKKQVSEGFLLPLQNFLNFCIDSVNKEPENTEPNTEFDVCKEGSKEFWISKKFIPGNSSRRHNGGGISNKSRGKVPRRLKKVIDTQFRFHYQTTLIKKCP